MVLPAAPVLAGVADNNAQEIISTRDTAPAIAATNANSTNTNGKFLASSSPATGTAQKGMLAPAKMLTTTDSAAGRDAQHHAKETPVASPGTSHFLPAKTKMLTANAQSDGNTATTATITSRSGNTSGLITPQGNRAATLVRSQSPLTGSGMLAGGKNSHATLAASGTNKAAAGSSVVYTEDNDSSAVSSGAGDTPGTDTARSSLLVKTPLLTSPHSKAPAKASVFSSDETSTGKDGLVITRDSDSAVSATDSSVALTAAPKASTHGLFTADNASTTRVSTAGDAVAGVKTDTAFLTKKPAPDAGNTGLFSGKTTTAATQGVSVTMSETTPTVASASAVALSENTPAPVSTARVTAASADKTASISVSTSEEGMPGYYPGPGTVTLTESSITTAGDGGTGIFSAEGSTVNVNTSIIATAGLGAAGVSAVTGSIALSESAVATAGDGSSGVFSADAGTVSVNRSAVATAGVGAAGVTAIAGSALLANSTVRTIGSDSAGIFSIVSGTVNAVNTSITTSGDNAHGVFTNNGAVTLSGGPVTTHGTGSAGIVSEAAGAVTAADTSVITTGDSASGVTANNGLVTLTDSAIQTSGAASTGIFSTSAGTVKATNTTVITTGDNASGVSADNGAITLVDSAVNTRGSASAGIFSGAAGTVNATNATVVTTGDNASGVSADNGAITLVDSSVNTRGNASAGIFSGAAGAVNATNATVVTTGDSANGVSADNGAITLIDSSVNTRGNASAGIFSGAAGTVNATNATVVTTGDNANGVSADNGTITLVDSSVNTRGSASAGIFSGAAGAVTAANATIIASGSNAAGVLANNGTVTLTDSTVNTSGSTSTGIFSGAAGSVTAANTTIIASGGNAAGVLASNGTVTLTDSTVSTSGSTSTGIFSGAAGAVKATSTTITTTGDNASGVFADNGEVILTDSQVNTRNTASAGIFSGSAGRVEATGTDVTTAGENAYALSVNQGTVDVNNGVLKAGNAAGIFAAGNNTDQQAGEVNLNAVTVDAAQSSVLTNGGMLNLNATGTTLNSDTDLVLDVRADATDPSINSTVNLNADSSMLNGSLVSDSTMNTSTVSLSNNSTLTGHSENISSVSLDGTSRWYMTANSDVQSLTNNGTIIFSESDSGDYKTLTVNGDYAGSGGTLVMSTLLGGDNSPTDKLIVTGNVEAGDTQIAINNMGGSGARTVEGIEVVSVGGVSEGTFTKSGRIVAGAYDYELEKVNESWYLTNKAPDVTDPEPGPGPNPGESQYRPETGSYLANMLAANTMFDHRMQDRLGEGSYARTADGVRSDGMWMRHVGSHNRFYDESGQLKARTNRYVLQLGYDLAQWSSDDDNRWHVGVMGGYGNAQSNIRSGLTGYRADGKVEGYSAGMYATWVESDKDISGAYVDGWVLYNWFRNTINGEALATEKYDSKGVTASLEAGYTVQMTHGDRVSSWLQPKVQLSWLNVRADNHREHNGTWVSDDTDGTLRSRVGARAYLKGYSELDENTDREFQPFVEANWLHNFGDYSVKMDDVTNSIAGDKNVGELKLGVEGRLADDFTMWGNVAQQVGSAGYSDTSAMFGTRVNF